MEAKLDKSKLFFSLGVVVLFALVRLAWFSTLIWGIWSFTDLPPLTFRSAVGIYLLTQFFKPQVRVHACQSIPKPVD